MPGLSLDKQAKRLRVYISESDRWRGKSLDSALLETFHKLGMAGATVSRGIAGFGAKSRISTSSIEVLSFDLPIIVEVIDTPEKINTAIEQIYPMVREGLITLDDVEIVKYTHRFLNPLPADRLVSEVMTTSVVSITPEAPVHEAWKRMLHEVIKALPVTDRDGKVIGILTDEDLTERAGIRQRLSIALRLDPDEVKQEMTALEDIRMTVADVMTSPAITVMQDENLGLATTRMVKSGLKRMPVTNKDGELVGMLSRLDILRQVSNITTPPVPPHLPQSIVRTVKDVMTTNIPMVFEDDSLATIIEKFSATFSHRLIVTDAAGKPIGLISDSDVVVRVQPSQKHSILEALKNIGKIPAGKETAFDLMSPGVLTISPGTPVTEASNLMLEKSRKWLVVIDESGKPVGLVDRQILLESVTTFYRQ